jgi:hypothetical protein
MRFFRKNKERKDFFSLTFLSQYKFVLKEKIQKKFLSLGNYLKKKYFALKKRLQKKKKKKEEKKTLTFYFNPFSVFSKKKDFVLKPLIFC